jgi:signal peptidase I
MTRRKLAKARTERAPQARAVHGAWQQAADARASGAGRRARRSRRVLSLKGLREGLLTFGAVAGFICIAATVASFAFGIQPVIFRSGSMSPAIDTGALAISRDVPAKDLKVGDVVTVKTDAGIRVTHRIKDVSLVNGEASLVLKGDANKTPDDKVYVVPSADRVLFSVPKAGYVVSWLSGPTGVFAGGLLAGLLVITAFGPGTRKPRRGGTRKLFGISIATVTVGLLATGVGGPTNTQAFYTDQATLASGTFTAGNYPGPVVKPVVTSCVRIDNGNNGDHPIKITWNAVPGANGYKVAYTNTGGGPQGNVSLGAAVLTFQTPAGAYKNTSGTISVVATFPSAPDSPATVYNHSGSGNPVANYNCVPAP